MSSSTTCVAMMDISQIVGHPTFHTYVMIVQRKGVGEQRHEKGQQEVEKDLTKPILKAISTFLRYIMNCHRKGGLTTKLACGGSCAPLTEHLPLHTKPRELIRLMLLYLFLSFSRVPQGRFTNIMQVLTQSKALDLMGACKQPMKHVDYQSHISSNMQYAQNMQYA